MATDLELEHQLTLFCQRNLKFLGPVIGQYKRGFQCHVPYVVCCLGCQRTRRLQCDLYMGGGRQDHAASYFVILEICKTRKVEINLPERGVRLLRRGEAAPQHWEPNR